jgi:hypothetical protein
MLKKLIHAFSDLAAGVRFCREARITFHGGVTEEEAIQEVVSHDVLLDGCAGHQLLFKASVILQLTNMCKTVRVKIMLSRSHR